MNENLAKYHVMLMNSSVDTSNPLVPSDKRVQQPVFSYNSLATPELVMNGSYVNVSFMEVKNNNELKKCELIVTSPMYVVVHEI